MFHLVGNAPVNPLFIGLPDTDETIIAAGPLSKQPSTVAYRIVLRCVANGHFIVHTQFFCDYPNLEKFDFSEGQYFTDKQLVEATAAFAERVGKHAYYLASLYRAA